MQKEFLGESLRLERSFAAEDVQDSREAGGPAAAHRLRDCKSAAQDKAPAVQDIQQAVVAKDRVEEEPSQAEEAIARQNDNMDWGLHRDLPRREESVCSDAALGRIHLRTDHAHALLRSLD